MPIVLVGLSLPLVHAHVDHHAGAIGRERVAGAGYFTRRAEKAELDHGYFLAIKWPNTTPDFRLCKCN